MVKMQKKVGGVRGWGGGQGGCEGRIEVIQFKRPPFWIYICLFLTALFHPKFMINVMTLILIWLTSRF